MDQIVLSAFVDELSKIAAASPFIERLTQQAVSKGIHPSQYPVFSQAAAFRDQPSTYLRLARKARDVVRAPAAVTHESMPPLGQVMAPKSLV